jgi:putative FmdB family regulatory protein
MPLYEYACESCEVRFEKIQKFSDPLIDVCPKCGGKVNKLPSSPAIQFKGSGFYITDYPKKSSSEASKAGSSKGTSESSSSPSDSKSSSDSKGASDGKASSDSSSKSSDSSSTTKKSD